MVDLFWVAIGLGGTAWVCLSPHGWGGFFCRSGLGGEIELHQRHRLGRRYGPAKGAFTTTLPTRIPGRI